MHSFFRKLNDKFKSFTNKLIKNTNVTASGDNVSCNGKSYKGNSIVVQNGKIYVDGVFVDKVKGSGGNVVVSNSSGCKSNNNQSININI
ncbi:hypothetical protein OTK49_03235 [Vibrio coralliirubri]|uniref:hypothetical protein n=1 Tax=Vibrio coralliirubri TaxID=1516159 RepID=UPI0022839E57|nr:hypothetical protein [Vibrio coralliirubri]MCY9861530.1 hypothetical protein [Vibrio coralliirubri]